MRIGELDRIKILDTFQESNSRENALSIRSRAEEGIEQHRRSIKFKCSFTASVQLYPQLRAAWNDNSRIVRGIRLSILK
jgi:hypothetical protein